MCGSAFAAERVTQHSVVAGPPGMPTPPANDSVIMWSKGRMRTEQGSTVTIMDFKSDKMVMLNQTNKTYSEIPLPELLKQLKAAMAAVQSQMKSLPAEQRAQLENVLDPKPLDLIAIDGEVKIGVFKTKKYLIKQNGHDAGEVFYTREIDVSELAPYAKKMNDTMKGMGSGWAEVLSRTEYGFPIRTILKMSAMGQTVTYTTEITAHDSPDPDDSAFKIPAGYKRAEQAASQPH